MITFESVLLVLVLEEHAQQNVLVWFAVPRYEQHKLFGAGLVYA